MMLSRLIGIIICSFVVVNSKAAPPPPPPPPPLSAPQPISVQVGSVVPVSTESPGRMAPPVIMEVSSETQSDGWCRMVLVFISRLVGTPFRLMGLWQPKEYASEAVHENNGVDTTLEGVPELSAMPAIIQADMSVTPTGKSASAADGLAAMIANAKLQTVSIPAKKPDGPALAGLAGQIGNVKLRKASERTASVKPDSSVSALLTGKVNLKPVSDRVSGAGNSSGTDSENEKEGLMAELASFHEKGEGLRQRKIIQRPSESLTVQGILDVGHSDAARINENFQFHRFMNQHPVCNHCSSCLSADSPGYTRSNPSHHFVSNMLDHLKTFHEIN